MRSQTHEPPGGVGTETGNGTAAAELDTERSRRALLKGLGVAAAGAVVGGVLTPDEAAAHGTFHQDSNNGTPAIHGNNSAQGPGVQGEASLGPGVIGSSNIGSGVRGISNQGEGVSGGSPSGTGVFGSSDTGSGVRGSSPSGTGVFGSSVTGRGVFGSSLSVDGTGVFGRSPSGTGVRAETSSGTALDVVGPAKFSTAGAGTIPANQNSVALSDSAVTADSHITMTLTGNPGSAGSGLPAVVVWIERQPGTGFTARLSRKVTNATPFTYLIVEPG